MNYLKVYISIVRNRLEHPAKSFYHKHHIFPKSIYGQNYYLVRLTPREHFICHRLLFKLFLKRYGDNHSNTRKMAFAFTMMSRMGKVQRGKDYELAQLLCVTYMQESGTYSTNCIKRNSKYGNPAMNPDYAKKISDSQKKRLSSLSEEERQRMADSNTKAGKIWWEHMLANNTPEQLKEYRNNLAAISKEKNSKEYLLTRTDGTTLQVKNLTDFAKSLGVDIGTFRYRLQRNIESNGFTKYEVL